MGLKQMGFYSPCHTKRPRIERLEAWRANPSILLNIWIYLDATNVAGLQIANANNEQRKAGVNNNNGAAVRTRALLQWGGGRANLVRVVIGHWGVKTIVFLHKKSAIRTFVGYCCSETSGFQARQLVIFTQMYSALLHSVPVLAAHLSSGNLPSS